jgi:hypothetical protein
MNETDFNQHRTAPAHSRQVKAPAYRPSDHMHKTPKATSNSPTTIMI